MTDILLPRPPRDSGWESDDLDMYDLPDHVELIYGSSLKSILYAKAEIPNYLRVAEGDNYRPVFFHYRLERRRLPIGERARIAARAG